MSQSTIFQSCRDRANASWVLKITAESECVLLKDTTLCPEVMEPGTSRFQSQCTNIRPPGSHCLTHLSMASLLWDICKQYSPRCDAAERVPSGAILFAQRNFIEKLDKNKNHT